MVVGQVWNIQLTHFHYSYLSSLVVPCQRAPYPNHNNVWTMQLYIHIHVVLIAGYIRLANYVAASVLPFS